MTWLDAARIQSRLQSTNLISDQPFKDDNDEPEMVDVIGPEMAKEQMVRQEDASTTSAMPKKKR
jgi:hypothetical protein